jgi:signal transduction histidine kinase
MRIPLLFLFILYSLCCTAQLKTELLASIKNPKKDKTTIESYLKLVKYYGALQLDSSVYYTEEGIKIARNLNDKMGEAKLLSGLALEYEGHDNLLLAEKLYKEALVIFQSLNSENEIATTISSIGVIEGKRGNYLGATNNFLKALEIFLKNKDNKGIAFSYLRLGVVNERNGNLDKALEYYNLAENYNTKGSLNNLHFTLINNIGIIYAQKGDMLKAIEYFEKGIKEIEGKEFISLRISLLNNCMKAYSSIGNTKKALTYHNLVIEVSRKYNLPREEARALYNYAYAFWEENPSKALTLLNEALKITTTINYKEFEGDIYELLSYIYKGQENYKEAYTNLLLHHNIKDSLFDVNKTKALTDLFSSFEMKETKAKINELQLNNEKTTHQRNIVIIVVVAALFILILLGYYIKRVRLLNTELSSSNKIKDKLFSIIGHDLKSAASSINQGLVFLQDPSTTEEDKQKMHKQLIKQSEVSLNTLTTLLSWGETQLKGFKLNKANTNVCEMVKHCELFFEAQVNNKLLTLVNNIPPTLFVFVDPNHLEIVLRNLISNAIKFSRENNTIELNANISKDDSAVIVSIKDNGLGISKEKQLQFLNSNIDITYGTKGEKGTGLGLLLVKELININNGRIWIESRENEGSTFFVQLQKASTD